MFSSSEASEQDVQEMQASSPSLFSYVELELRSMDLGLIILSYRRI